MKDDKNGVSLLGVDIKDVQRLELGILLEFDRICKKHGIKYQLYAGTLIGAIRHGGFIPWDDDIDVCMLRSEYDKFLSWVEIELNNEYFFQTYETDLNYINKFAKIRKNKTIFMEASVKDLDMHHGVYIDIFALDNIELKTLKGKWQILVIRVLDSFFKYRLKNRYETLNRGLKRSWAKFRYVLINKMPISKLKIEDITLTIMTKFNHIKTDYVADLANPSKGILEKFMMRREILDDSIDGQFEGNTFPIPRAYDEVLRRAYGDYMKQPELDERVSHHHIIKINSDTGEN